MMHLFYARSIAEFDTIDLSAEDLPMEAACLLYLHPQLISFSEKSVQT